MDPQQQFCLKWNSYSSNLAMTFSNLFKSELLADVTLFCGGKLKHNSLFFGSFLLFRRPTSRHKKKLFSFIQLVPCSNIVMYPFTSTSFYFINKLQNCFLFDESMDLYRTYSYTPDMCVWADCNMKFAPRVAKR